MATYDLVVLSVLVLAGFSGLYRGLSGQLAALLTLCASYFIAFNWHGPVARAMDVSPPGNTILAILILLIGTRLLLGWLFRLGRRAVGKGRLRRTDRLAGAGLGLLKGWILSAALTLALMLLLGPNWGKGISTSLSGRAVLFAIDQGRGAIPAALHGSLDRFLARQTGP